MQNIKKGFVSLLGLLIAVGIIFFLAYIVITTYVKKPALDQETQKTLDKEGINTLNYQGVLESTRSKVKDINRKIQDRQQTDY